MAESFIGGGSWRKPPTYKNVPRVTDKLYHIIVYRIHLDVTEHYTWRQIKVTTLIAVLHFTFTVGSSTMSIVHTLK